MCNRSGTRWLAVAVLLAAWGDAAADAEPPAEPYRQLRAGYAAADATAAASAYAPDAVYTEAYPGAPEVTRRGRQEIAAGFAELFRALGAAGSGTPLDLNFRLLSRGSAPASREHGVYRLRVGREDGGRQETYFGTFTVERRDGLLVRDSSGPATRADFEDASGPVMFAADDETLDPAYYDRFLGTWRDATGCVVRITRSMRRLFAEDVCARTWRGLTRESGRRWVAGDAVLSARRERVFEFGDDALVVSSAADVAPRRLMRAAAPVREAVRFRSGDVELAGAVLRPPARGEMRRPAFVVVHGSGPQDRHGYASIVDTLAQELAAAGAVVLVYDKRGVGGSQGDWSRAGFDVLAADARAAAAHLRARADVDPERIGFAGSSQAGWVVARAIDDGARPAFVLLLGAAGSATTVREQNLYNTATRMRCAGIDAHDVDLALAQQAAFFDARRDRAKSKELARLSSLAVQRSALSDWLFPADVPARPTGEWYDVLDADYDPRRAWRTWRGPGLFVFTAFDDSTPTDVAARRAREDARGAERRIVVLRGAQHLGLRASGTCDGELERVDGFHPELWPTVRTWLAEVVRARR